MSYTAWSVAFSEQPSAAKWNILGTNDASFNDGTGIANLALNTTALSNPYKFSAYRNAAWTSSNGSYGLVTFDTEYFDTNSNFDTATGKYVAPVSGFYWFSAVVGWSPGIDGDFGSVALYKNGSLLQVGGSLRAGGESNGHIMTVAGLFSLSASDYVQVYFYGDGGAGLTGTNSLFCGELRSRT